MKDSDIKAEIKALKAEIAKLNKAKKGDSKSKTKAINLDSDMFDGISLENVKSQFHDFFDALDTDLGQSKPSSLLMVFALGIVVGKLMSK